MHFELYSNQRTNHKHNPQIKTNASCPRVALVALSNLSDNAKTHNKVSLYHGPSCESLAGVRLLTGLGTNTLSSKALKIGASG